MIAVAPARNPLLHPVVIPSGRLNLTFAADALPSLLPDAEFFWHVFRFA